MNTSSDGWPASVVTNVERPPETVLRGLEVSTATLHEAMGQEGALPAAIKPLAAGMRVCGPVVTVSCPPGHNLRIHHAIYLAQPGDVLVVDVGGGHEHGYWGEVMTVAAMARGLGGLVIDGCVRDGDRLVDLGLPVFCRGRCIRGTGKDPIGGTINHALRLGEVEVQPGDIVVGDDDGVVVVPRAQATDVAAAAGERESKEALILARLAEGATTTLDVYGFDPAALR